MSENQPPEEASSSGSRWEDAEEAPLTDSVGDPASAASSAAPPSRSHWTRGKAALIGAGVGVALLAGSGGFALGHAAAEDDDHGFRGGGWHGSEEGMPMPPAERGPGFDPGQRPGFGEQMEPRSDGPDDDTWGEPDESQENDEQG